MARTFNQLKKEKSLEELNRFAEEVTERYATSKISYSQRKVAQDNNLTPQGLRNLMDYAIKTAKVSLKIAYKVHTKATANQQRKHQEAGKTSKEHHESLMRERAKYIALSYSRFDINKIATDIANHPEESIQDFTKKYNIESDRVTKNILQRAIIEDVIPDGIMEKIIERSLKTNSSKYAELYFEALREEREKRKKQAL